MRRVFLEKLRTLARGEDGVALITTLAVFFFIYLLIAGVYALGAAVRERIHLQNACDAAAYSAAVVQADTLSRIATLNRALSWTYAQATRRQMDRVVRSWLTEVHTHWTNDYATAESWAAASTASCDNTTHTRKKDFSVSGVTLRWENTSTTESADTIKAWCDAVDSSSYGASDDSFYAADALTDQIAADWQTICDLNAALTALVATGRDEITNAAVQIARANLGDATATPLVIASEMDDYLEDMATTKEDLFLAFGGEESVSSAFGNGTAWFEQKQTDTGFRRGFKSDYSSGLCATWTWYTRKWMCTTSGGGPGGGSTTHSFTSKTCTHGSHTGCECTSSSTGETFGTLINNKATVYASNNTSAADTYYQTPEDATAKPKVLTDAYFGSNGTITVALLRPNTNAWTAVFGVVTGGIYAAFSPWVRDSVAFASAKAGYRTYAEGKKRGRNYKIDWSGDDADWNLYTSDWDAVFVPVRMAESEAKDGKWGAAGSGFLARWVRALGVDDERMRAGGTHEPGDYKTARDYAKEGAVAAKWLIGNPTAKPDWTGLQDRLLH